MAKNSKNQTNTSNTSDSESTGVGNYGGKGAQGGKNQGFGQDSGYPAKSGQNFQSKGTEGKGSQTGGSQSSQGSQSGQGGQSAQLTQKGNRDTQGQINRGTRPTPGAKREGGSNWNSESGSETVVLTTCAAVCNETLSYCLEQGEEFVASNQIKALIDCIDICTVTAAFIARGSEYAPQLKECAAEIVKAAQETCEGFSDDECLAACAEACGSASEYLGA